jgi:FKBP-type peptidyl-prolyl cis-trans isomerase FkpA
VRYVNQVGIAIPKKSEYQLDSRRVNLTHNRRIILCPPSRILVPHQLSCWEIPLFYPQEFTLRSVLVLTSLLGALLATAVSAQTPAKPAPAKEVAAITTASGLSYKSLLEGTGASPAATDTVKVHYRGTLPDGTEFDSSYKRGEPAEFPLNRVIKCWTEGVQRMKVGGKARLVCPPGIAYGERSPGAGIPPNATLNFDIELLAIRKP